MDEEIISYVQSCPECQKNKSRRHRSYGLLSPLELPHTPWQSIAMDFITDLPLTDGYNQLWVIVDRFSKMAHFIPLKEDTKKAEHLCNIFIDRIWKYHGSPQDIVSDRDSRFTSEIWQVFLETLKIKPRMSTAFHPQTDGQTERVNQSIEAYLRPFLSENQENWGDLLPMAEYAYNNSVTSATGETPFNTNYGRHPVTLTHNSKGTAAEGHAAFLQDIHQQAIQKLEEARKRMVRNADKLRKEAPEYKIGQLVLLSGQHIKTKQPSKKLGKKYHGPFQVEKVISPTAIRLRLPRKWKKHPTFHVSEI